MRKRKSSSNDTTPLHPYIADVINSFPTQREKAMARLDWKTSKIKRNKKGEIVSIQIITKNV